MHGLMGSLFPIIKAPKPQKNQFKINILTNIDVEAIFY